MVVYFVLGLALLCPAPCLEVMRHLVEGLRGQGRLTCVGEVLAVSGSGAAGTRALAGAVRHDRQADGHRSEARYVLAGLAAAGGWT